MKRLSLWIKEKRGKEKSSVQGELVEGIRSGQFPDIISTEAPGDVHVSDAQKEAEKRTNLNRQHHHVPSQAGASNCRMEAHHQPPSAVDAPVGSAPPPETSTGLNLPPDNNSKMETMDSSQFKATKLVRRGTMSADEMANAQKRLLEDIHEQACQKLAKGELEILMEIGNEIGLSLKAEQIIDTVQAWKDNLEKKRGRMITFPWGGKTLNVTKLLDDAVNWIRRFREIGDVVVQCDPVHLGLPWAGIKFLTQIVVEDRDNIAAISITLERVTNVTALSTAYVALLSQSGSRDDTSGQQLKACLVQLQTAILSFLASGVRYLKNHKKEAGKSLLKLSAFEENLKQINERMRQVQEFREVMSVQDAARHRMWEKDQFKKLVEGLGEGLKITESLAKDLNEQKRHDLLNWISTTPYMKHHRDAGERILEGTGNWLFENTDEFYAWKESASATPIFWLQGNPGVGKTYLTHAAIEWQRQYTVVVYFYCSSRDNDNARRNPEGIMRSLLKALVIETGFSLEEDFPELSHRYQSRAENGELSMDETCTFISQVLKMFEYPRIFIDALDEVYPRDRSTLLKRLFALVGQTNLKLWVSSRVEEDIKLMIQKQDSKLAGFRQGGAVKTLLVGNENMGDIKSFVEREVDAAIEDSRLLEGDVEADFRDLIIQKLSDRAEGMFLWARLQVLNICDVHFPDHILHQLETLPKGLESTYDAIYNTINKEGVIYSVHAKNALRWVMCATRPLKLEEWRELVQLSSEDIPASVKANYLEKICHNLIAVDRESGTVRFVHLSVREFLNQQPDFNIIQPDNMAARGCLQHLVRTETPDQLLPYVIENWPIHCRQAIEESSGSADIVTIALDFFKDKDAHKRWLGRVVTDDLDAHSTLNPLFTVARYGIPRICPVIMQDPQEFGVDKAHRNLNRRTPLHLAVKFGHSKILQELLESADRVFDVNARDDDGRTPFALAVFLKMTEITQQFIRDENVDANIADSLALGGFPPLVRATWQGNVALVGGLLHECKPRLDVDAVNGRGETALHWAVKRSHVDIVRMLLANGANVNIQSSNYEVPLYISINLLAAAYTPHRQTDRDIFTMLCNHPEVNFHIRDGMGNDIPCRFLWCWTSIEKLYYKNHSYAGYFPSMFQEIVGARNCNVNVRGDCEGDNPLLSAAQYAIVDAAHALLKLPDIDVNAISQYQFGNTALHIAVQGGSAPHERIAEALIACESVDIRATNDYGETPLMKAVRLKRWKLARLLLQREGVDDDVLENIENNRDLADACRIPNNHQEMLKLLGIESPSGEQLVPLIPERQRQQRLVDQVIEAAMLPEPAEAKEKLQQLDINITTADRRTALALIAFRNQYSRDMKCRGFRALLDIDGIQISTFDYSAMSALDYAVVNGDIELVGLLLARPELQIDPVTDSNSISYKTPVLLQSILEGQVDIVNALAKDPRVDVNVVDKYGLSACYRAMSEVARPRAEQMFMALLNSNRLDINYQSIRNGETLIFRASELNDEVIVRILLDHADLTSLDEPSANWYTPLGIATMRGNVNIVKMLLEKGANLHWRNYQGMTPLDIAIEAGRVEIVELLTAAMGSK